MQIAASKAMASQITSSLVIDLANKDRAEQDIPLLQENDVLTEAAQKKVADMVDNGYFAHTSPKGIEPWHWFDSAGYNYLYAGENLAINYKNAEDQEKAWMNSPTHRKNILNPKYEDIGVAMAVAKIDGHDSLIVVQMFGKLADGSAAVAATNKRQQLEISEVKSVEVVNQSENTRQVLSLQPEKTTINVSSDRTFAGYVATFLTMLAFFIAIVADVLIAFKKRQEEGIMV